MSNLSREKSWIKEVRNSLNIVNPTTELQKWNKNSIYRVPACIKDLNSKAYKPQLVSFGPFHHREPQLMPMEEHKHRALLHFLKRTKQPLEHFVAAVEEVVVQLQESYQNLDERWIKDRDGFVQLMIVDGCFMLEIMCKSTNISFHFETTGHRSSADDYVHNDPIFSAHGMLYTVPYIKRDMLMIENQLPLLVLERLIATAGMSKKSIHLQLSIKVFFFIYFTMQTDENINRLVLKFLAPNLIARPFIGLSLHPLDLYRKTLLIGPQDSLPDYKPDPNSSEIIRSAMELYEAGIRFKQSRTTSLHDIHFKHGVLRLPVIVVDDLTEYMFLNLMAFERLHVGAGNDVTSYVFFMDNIIDSAKDVSLLTTKGIIQNAVGSDKAVAKLFNSLSKDVVLEPDSNLDKVQRMVNVYCQKQWNMWRANLLHTYFRSPWAFLSLAAAIFLLVMTVMQTVYTVLQYYEGNSSPSAPPAAPSPQ
ncbi:hypothetical protein FCM35_KLT21014 [Carex littledalei]|uniref:Uncharacterized protein n=1 Tax=Carex littledalei TaxID=544730 RepID=A0A833VNG4_9POAL|nr:hypothetical protein FCM35_KLT21014 [Carex littledalei]